MKQEEVWDFIAKEWHDYRQKPLTQVEEFLARKKKGKIFDLGCGTGRNFIKGFNWYGIDFSAKMVKLAKKKPYIKVMKVNASKLPFKDNFFDYALYVATLHCIRNPGLREESLAELARVLKPKAKALISVWNKESKKFLGERKEACLTWGGRGEKKVKRFYYLYEKAEFLRLLRKYFKIIKVYSYSKKQLEEMDKSSRRFAKRNLIAEVSKKRKI